MAVASLARLPRLNTIRARTGLMGHPVAVERDDVGMDSSFESGAASASSKLPEASPASTQTPLPRSLSPSSASTFRQCARRWKFRYIDKLPDPPGEPALRGTFVHQVLEELLALVPPQRTLERARAICRELWPQTAANTHFAALALDETRQRAFRWNAWADVEGYFTLENPAAVDVVGCERRVQASLDGVPFRGVVDLVDHTPEGLRVTDYKTGRAPPRRFVDNRLSQVWLYAAALDSSGEDVSSVRLLYLGETGAGRDRRRPTAVSRAVDADAVCSAVEEHRVTWDRITQALTDSQFEPSPGPLCSWCPYRDDCPEGQAEHQRRTAVAA
ncbi:RecB family exonuclease [Candidatus Poriferisodalis sp.]|uniref:RecB family exonuclease n=1 Tax=Candidatus Poriferisodalis sp. TaxID=3101277 RepID=UPI003B027764